MRYEFRSGEAFARQLDDEDDLKDVRKHFYVNDEFIYMEGNSMGMASRPAEAALLRVFDEYKTMMIGLWYRTKPMLFLYQDYLSNLMAPMVGAEPEEVTVHANTSINLHTLIATFYKPDRQRYKILVDELNFPTCRYVVESQVKLKGLDPAIAVKEVKSLDGLLMDEDRIIEAMTDDVAIAVLPSVLYRSCQLLDMEKLTKAAHERGIIIGFDCGHSVGAVPHRLSEWDVDFAAWCTFKYCNGGPGSPAGLYINKKHFGLGPGLAGWHGYVKEKQFDLLNVWEPARNAGGWQTGTQHILSMAPLEGSLKIFAEVGMARVRAKSLKITAYLMYLIDHELAGHGFSIATPREDERRGGHVTLQHEDAPRISRAIVDRGVLSLSSVAKSNRGVRGGMRLTPAALYTTYHDVYRMVAIIKQVMDEKSYERYEVEKPVVDTRQEKSLQPVD